MALNKSPSMTHPSCIESSNRPLSSMDKLILPPINEGDACVNRPKSQPLKPSRIPSLLIKPDRSASVPNLESLNTDTPRPSRAAQTRPWRPGSVSPQQILSETRLPNPKLTKFLDRDWKSMSILPSYPIVGPKRNSPISSGRSSSISQYSVNSPKLAKDSPRSSRIPVLVSGTNEMLNVQMNLLQIEKVVSQVSVKDSTKVPTVCVTQSEMSEPEQNGDGNYTEEDINVTMAKQSLDSNSSTEEYKTEAPSNQEFPRLSFLAKRVADEIRISKDIKGQETGDLTHPEAVEGHVATASEESHAKKTEDTSFSIDLNNNKGGWHYYSTERVVLKPVVSDVMPTLNKIKDVDTVTSETDITDTGHNNQAHLKDNVTSELEISNTTNACSPMSSDGDKSSIVDIEDDHPSTARTNEDVEVKTILTADSQPESQIITEPYEKENQKKKIKQKKKILRVEDKIERQLLDCVAKNPDCLSNNEAFEMISVIHGEDNEAANMLDELKLLTRLEKEQEDKILKSKAEEDQLVADLEKYKNKLADTIDKKKKIDERLLKIYKVELDPDTEFAVIEEYLLAEKLAKTYHEKRNFEECSIAFIEHQLQTVYGPTSVKPIKKAKEPKIKPRMTKNALRLQKDKGNKIRHEKIQKIEEQFNDRARNKKGKDRKGKFFKEPSNNNYRPMLPQMDNTQNELKVDQCKARKTDKPVTRKSVVKKEVQSGQAGANTLKERKSQIKRNKGIQNDSQKSTKTLSGKEIPLNKENTGLKSLRTKTGSNLAQMKPKSNKGQIESPKAFPKCKVKENIGMVSKVGKQKYQMISGTNKTETLTLANTVKIQNGYIRREKMEPNRIKHIVHSSNAGSLAPFILQPGKQTTKTRMVSNVNTTSNKKQRVKLPPLPKPKTKQKDDNPKMMQTSSKPDFVF